MSTVLDAAVSLRRRDRLFYTGFAVGAMALVFAAFGRTYYLKTYTGAPQIPSLVHLHGAVFSAWMGLFALQTWLVRSKRVDLHRRLGVAGGVFAVALVGLGYAVAILGAQTGWAGPGNPRDAAEGIRFLVIPLGDLVVFVGFFALALAFRRQPETHKRLMLLAMVGGILPAAFGRTGAVAGIILGVAFLGAGPLYDRIVRGRVHQAYGWGIGALVLSLPLRIWLGQSEPWRHFAQWLIR